MRALAGDRHTVVSHHQLVLLIVLLAGLLACGAGAVKPNGELTAAGGYRHKSYDYSIEPIGSTLMPETWRLANFYEKRGKLVPKDERVNIHFDLDGDDKPDENREFQAYDVRFEHVQTAGVIRVVAYPESGTDRHKRLEVLMNRLLQSYASTGEWIALVAGPQQKVVAAGEDRITADIESKGTATLAGREAYLVTFDRVNVDQAKVASDARLASVQLVLAKTGIDYTIEDRIRKDNIVEKVKIKFPVMLLALYQNQPEFFAENLAEFHGLLNRVRVGREMGFAMAPATAPTAAPTQQQVEPPNPAPAQPAPAQPAPAQPAPAQPAPAQPAPAQPASPAANVEAPAASEPTEKSKGTPQR